MILVLPYPPPANRYWRMWRGRMVKSEEAREYQRKVALLAKQQKWTKPFSGPVAVSISVYRPRKSGDLDGRFKVPLDAIQGVAYDNDSQVVEFHAWRRDDKDNPRIVVEVLQAREEAA